MKFSQFQFEKLLIALLFTFGSGLFANNGAPVILTLTSFLEHYRNAPHILIPPIEDAVLDVGVGLGENADPERTSDRMAAALLFTHRYHTFLNEIHLPSLFSREQVETLVALARNPQLTRDLFSNGFDESSWVSKLPAEIKFSYTARDLIFFEDQFALAEQLLPFDTLEITISQNTNTKAILNIVRPLALSTNQIRCIVVEVNRPMNEAEVQDFWMDRKNKRGFSRA